MTNFFLWYWIFFVFISRLILFVSCIASWVQISCRSIFSQLQLGGSLVFIRLLLMLFTTYINKWWRVNRTQSSQAFTRTLSSSSLSGCALKTPSSAASGPAGVCWDFGFILWNVVGNIFISIWILSEICGLASLRVWKKMWFENSWYGERNLGVNWKFSEYASCSKYQRQINSLEVEVEYLRAGCLTIQRELADFKHAIEILRGEVNINTINCTTTIEALQCSLKWIRWKSSSKNRRIILMLPWRICKTIWTKSSLVREPLEILMSRHGGVAGA